MFSSCKSNILPRTCSCMFDKCPDRRRILCNSRIGKYCKIRSPLRIAPDSFCNYQSATTENSLNRTGSNYNLCRMYRRSCSFGITAVSSQNSTWGNQCIRDFLDLKLHRSSYFLDIQGSLLGSKGRTLRSITSRGHLETCM